MRNIKYALFVFVAGLVSVAVYFSVAILASESETACDITNVFSRDFSDVLNSSIEDSLSDKNPSIDFRKIGPEWHSVCLTSRGYAGNYDSYSYARNVDSHYDLLRQHGLRWHYKGKVACWGWSDKYITAIFLSKDGMFAQKLSVPQERPRRFSTSYSKAHLQRDDLSQCSRVKDAVASCVWWERKPGQKLCHLYFRTPQTNPKSE